MSQLALQDPGCLGLQRCRLRQPAVGSTATALPHACGAAGFVQVCMCAALSLLCCQLALARLPLARNVLGCL